MILILSLLHQFNLTFYCFNKNMNTNIDISDVEDFEIELVNPEFEQVYIKKTFHSTKIFV